MKKRILIVEDSPTQAIRAQLIVEDAGYLVERAENGKAGLDKARAAPPDLVVADIVMPEMDGYELTTRLRQDPRTASIPILMLTSQNEPLDVIRGLEAGADHFITKPYGDQELVRRINALFAQSRAQASEPAPEQDELHGFERQIVITKSREQVLEALLTATARVTGCQAMSLFSHAGDDQPVLFVISLEPLAQSSVKALIGQVTRLLARMHPDVSPELSLCPIEIVTDPDQPERDIEDGLAHFLHAPLIVEGHVTGLISIFDPKPGEFDDEHVRFLFDIGQTAAKGLSRIEAAE